VFVEILGVKLSTKDKALIRSNEIMWH